MRTGRSAGCSCVPPLGSVTVFVVLAGGAPPGLDYLRAAVDVDDIAGDPGAVVAGQEGHHPPYVIGRSLPSEQRQAEEGHALEDRLGQVGTTPRRGRVGDDGV